MPAPGPMPLRALPSPLEADKMEQIMSELDAGQRACVGSCLECWQVSRGVTWRQRSLNWCTPALAQFHSEHCMTDGIVRALCSRRVCDCGDRIGASMRKNS
jgi:hypothetical protein